MIAFESATNTSPTLDQRLAEEDIPAAQALSYAISLAEALRQMHDAGQVHGAVSPVNITVSGTRLELLPAAAPTEGATPYTAPELLQLRHDVLSKLQDVNGLRDPSSRQTYPLVVFE